MTKNAAYFAIGLLCGFTQRGVVVLRLGRAVTVTRAAQSVCRRSWIFCWLRRGALGGGGSSDPVAAGTDASLVGAAGALGPFVALEEARVAGALPFLEAPCIVVGRRACLSESESGVPSGWCSGEARSSTTRRVREVEATGVVVGGGRRPAYDPFEATEGGPARDFCFLGRRESASGVRARETAARGRFSGRVSSA